MSTDPSDITPTTPTPDLATPTPTSIPPHEPIVETATKSGPIPTPEPPAGYRWLIPGQDKLEATDMTWTGLKTIDGVLTRTLEPVFHAQAGATCSVFNTYLREIAHEQSAPVMPGYRFLGQDEVIEVGDEWWSNNRKDWVLSSFYGKPVRSVSPNVPHAYRRKIRPEPAPTVFTVPTVPTIPPETGNPPQPANREVRLILKTEVTDESQAKITELQGEVNFARGMWREWETAAKDRAAQVLELEKASAADQAQINALTAENGNLKTTKANAEEEIASLQGAKGRVWESFYKVAERLQIQTLHLTKLAHWMEMEEVRTSSMEYSSALAILNFIIDASKSKDATANE